MQIDEHTNRLARALSAAPLMAAPEEVAEACRLLSPGHAAQLAAAIRSAGSPASPPPAPAPRRQAE